MKINITEFGTNCKLPVLLFTLYFLLAMDLNAQADSIQTDVPAIKNVYANDFYFGCLLSYRHVGFPDDPYVPGQSAVEYPLGGELIRFHMNSMSPGNNMKPQYTVDISTSAAAYNSALTEEEKDSINTHPVIRFNGNLIAQLNWAKRQGFTFRGHTLVWHSQHPGTSFFKEGYSDTGVRLTKEKMTERMENYIKEVIRLLHEGWPGLLSAMDVVNEAVNDNGTDRSSGNEWYTTFGDNSFIMKAFEFARKYTIEYGETQMKLYYNDYNTSTASKADGIVRICKPIFEAGYLDGIGMQEHDGYNSPTAAQWITSYNKFYPICTEMAVTEFDIKPSNNTLTSAVLTQQANQYAMLFKCFVERSFRSGRGKIVSVSKDGLNDASAFVANASLWDGNYQCKPAFYASVNVGINYNALDSLIVYADTLNENEFTAESWSAFSTALTAAVSARDRNYSNTMPAADSLGKAKVNLSAAISGLVKNPTNVEGGNNPGDFMLSQNYPNPFNPETVISYTIGTGQIPVGTRRGVFVQLKVYDILGNEVATLVNEEKAPGYYQVKFSAGSGGDGSNLSSGVYFYRLNAGSYTSTKKFVLMK